MFMIGESVYRGCERPEKFDSGGETIELACPFQTNPVLPRKEWCRVCLLAKIRSLELTLTSIADRALKDSTDKY